MRWARPSTTAVLPTPGSPISTGLFFVRRDRICITRSISVWRPTTGSSFDSAASFVRLRPNWSRSFELFDFSPGAPPAPCCRRPGPESTRMISLRLFSAAAAEPRRPAGAGEHADDLVADLLGVGVEVEQDACRDALVLAHEAEQDVLRADVVVPE